MEVVLNALIMFCLFLPGKRFVFAFDKQLAAASKQKRYAFPVAICFLTCVAFVLSAPWQCIFWVSLVLAAYCDYLTNEIFDIVYLPTMLVCAYMVLQCGLHWGELIVFCGLQIFLFSRFYCESDCISFCMCAMYLTALGGEMHEYLMLMAWTIIILTVVQLCKRNMSVRGNLKNPVGLIPYITAAMLYMQFTLG